jgi:hypothetical protein
LTQPTTFSFGKFLLKVGDGASPEVFSAPCGLTAKAFNQTNTTVESIVPDCDDPDAPANVERGITSKSRDISGTALLTSESFQTWQDFYDSDYSKNVRVYPMGASGGYYQGKFILATFNIAAPAIGQKSTGDITLQSDGPCPWTPGS